ncbi:uncharacterized protein LOC127287997 isoform X4 [Leptopilina boulardi]|uniref:uncharacterized protein LOC127287997 isoform X4 n=1 Tax=Leptopilina boulardi TaxID=63433 RepID=UPI0021F55A9D|nr:uncharacterized protein LOC127287997 isoform X4 [Leptopilina boulardi]
MSRVRSLLTCSALLTLTVLLSRCLVNGSEFPERECCDPIYPIPEPTSKAPSAPTPTGRSGSDIKAPIAILNCLFARQLCFDDSSCSAILEIIPRVCGPELVACSTVTVSKCQAALKTLQAFSFFRPTCLCREPHVDPECNNFRDFLFDHPCIYVLKKGARRKMSCLPNENLYKEAGPIDTLPNCNHALSVCQREKSCTKLFEDFKSNCKARDGKCRIENRDACHDAWTQLRKSPMFGCICPNNHMKRRCDRIFSVVNHNPCIVKYISHPDNSTTLEVESQLENPLIDVHQQDFNDLRKFPIPEIHHHRTHHRKNHSNDEQEPGLAIPSSLPDSERIIPQPTKVILTSTCHHAYASCKNDPDCRALLQPVLNHCDQATCARNECMDALQYFYKSASHKHSVEIAFCLCKTNDEKRNDCTVAKEKMHPQCAQRPEGPEIPTCHSLAELCRDERSCRSKLEFYEQSCAVDSVTKKCAGSTSVCREALLGILGTELRTTCACKGTDLSQIYDCVGWQRLLWVNPCVVESQKDYHARRKHHLHPRTTTISAMSTTRAVTATTESVIVAEVEDNVIPEITTRQSTTETTTTEFVELTTTSVVTTPSTTTTSTTPPRYCVVERGRQSHQYIREGKGKRLYRDDEPDCSELCQCGEGEVLICNTICVKSSPCKTDFAYYNHAAPAYQAYRGRCLCYSGRFICMRPSPDAYSIPHGVFMFLGYSETDETLLRPHNNLTVLDAVSSLDSFMREEVNNQTVCTLFLYNVTKENVIAAVRLGTDNPPPNISESQNLQHLLRVKEECASMLQDLSDKINNKHQEVHTHPLLSIFKMAEVEVKLPLTSKATTLTSKSSTFFLGLTLLISGFLQRTTTSMLISTFTDDLIS